MEEPSSSKIMRKSIHTFLVNYHRLTTTAASLAVPFAVALLLSQPFFSSSSVLFSLYYRLKTLFHVAGFPASFHFFSFLSLKLSQTICSYFLTLPFSLSFLLFSKAYTINHLSLLHNHSSLSDFHGFSVYYLRLLRTHICNSLFLLSANASAFALLFLGFNLLEGSGFSSNFVSTLLAAVLYSIILANALVISNLALISAAEERSSSSSGLTAILRAFVLIRGRTSMALALALPTNLGLAAVEALFHYRITKSYYIGQRDIASLVLEGTLIAYLYAIFLVLDTVVNFLFFQSCKKEQQMELEQGYSFKIEIIEAESGNCIGRSKGFQEFP